VSPALASLALRHKPGPSPTSRKAVLQAADDLGYRVNTAASLLAKNRSHLIGVALDLSQSFHVEAVDHVYRVAEAAGYNVLLSAVTSSRPLDRATESLIEGSCEGILIVGMHSVPESLLGSPTRMPVAVLGHAEWTGSFDVVRTAGDLGVRSAVDHLVSLGHTRIAHVDGGDNSGAEERRRGYVEGMREHALGDLLHIQRGGNDEEDGLRAGRELLERAPATTAVICYNDSCAVGMIQAAEQAGLTVPEGMSIIGYDNSPVGRTSYLGLTTVAQDTRRLTEISVQRLIEGIENPARPHTETVLPPRLITRSTTGPARPGPAAITRGAADPRLP
jgi:DNA-binding LacI/PurR family transcriptional regulator